MTALVVDCADTTVYVWAGDENALDTLNKVVAAGGSPVGFITVGRHGERVDVGSWPLEEFSDNEDVVESLKQLTLSIAFKLDEQGRQALE